MEKRRKKITFLQRILCLALSVIMLLGTVLPTHAYSASGSEAISKGDMDIGEGIRVNDCKKYIDLYNTDSSKIAKVGAKVQVWSKNTEHYKDQCFTFEKENGYYRILLAANPNYCLYVKADGYLALGKVKAGNDSQLWNIIYED